MDANLKQHHFANQKVTKLSLLALLVSGICHSPISRAEQPFYFNFTTDASLVQQETRIDSAEDRDRTNRIVRPELELNVNTRIFQGFAAVEYNWVDREVNDDENKENYTNYRFGFDSALIPDLLFINANGRQSWQGFTSIDSLSSDFLVNEDRLSKVNQNEGRVALILPESIKAVDFSAQLGFNENKIENQNLELGLQNLDTQNRNAGFLLGSGITNRTLLYSLEGADNRTQREEQGDFDSWSIEGNIDYLFFDNTFGLTVKGFAEENTSESQLVIEEENVDIEFSPFTRKFGYAGVGLAFYAGADKFLKVFYNKSDAESEPDAQPRDGQDDFVGGELSWRFGSRMNLAASYDRRFFGDNAAFEFGYRFRNLRAGINYAKEVRAQSAFGIESELNGIFICDEGYSNINQCALQDQLTAPPLANQTLLPSIIGNAVLNENIVITERAGFSAGYTRRRLTLALNSNFLQTETLEREPARVLDNFTTELTAGLRVSDRSRFNLRVRYTKLDEEVGAIENDSRARSAALDFSQDFGRYLSAKIGLSYLDSKGNVSQGAFGNAGIDGDFSDTRVFLTVTYQYNSKR